MGYGPVNGTPLSDLATDFGLSVAYDPNTNEVMIYNPTMGKSISFVNGKGGVYGVGGFTNGQNIVTDAASLSKYIGSFADGGMVDQTGWAQLHGSKTSPEWILNSDQMKNLVGSMGFNFTKNTPNTVPIIFRLIMDLLVCR